MARALESDPINQLEENLQCNVCLEVLTDPRTLPCCHSFCKDCLEGVVQTLRGKAPRGRPIREFPCPNCRATFTLDPDKHVADMPRNHFICNMVKAIAVLDRGIGVPCSHSCSQRQSYSVARCVTCEKFLCRECLAGHNNYRANNGHSVLTMEELSKPENRRKINDKMYCNEHSGMILKVYCKTCDQLICRDCMDFKHVKQGHSCVLVKDVANNYKELLASNNNAMEDVLTEGNALLQRLMLTTEQLDRDAENIKSQIVQKNDIVLKIVAGMLEQKTKTLLNKVDEIRKAGRAKLDRKAEETKLYIENVKGSVQLSKTLVDQGTEEEIISSQKMMLDNANNLLTDREEYFKAPIPVNKLSYTVSGRKEPINKEILRELANSLGEVNDDNAGTGIGRTKRTFLRIAAESASHSETIEVNQKLDDRQFAEILEVQDLHNVCIECEPVIGFIRISGLAENVSNAVGEIHRIIYAWELERHHKDATVREVQWFYYEGDVNFVIPAKYADSISAKIERAYKNDPSGSLVVGEKMKFEIDFKTMTERCLDPSENEIMKVYRRPCEAFPLPPNWEFQPIDCSTGKERDVHRFTIDKHDMEYDQIHDMFKASLITTLPNAEVVRIERIQNPRLHQIYEGQKKKMSNGGNEMRLFQGTEKAAVENVNTTGFNRAYCGKNVVKFGKGVYFAKHAWNSARMNCAAPDDKGLQYMYYARVLVGKYTKGKEGLLVPPPIDKNNQTVCYDSVVDDVTKPIMFVIFFDYQSYPEYLITFKNP